MITSINSKRTPPPPPRRGTFNRRLRLAGALLAVFATSLLLIACPSPGGGGDTNPSDGGGGGTTAPDEGTPRPPAPDPEKPTPEPPTPPPKPKAWHVDTFAGGGPAGTDGIGPAAGFAFLFGIAQSGDTLYVTDFTRHSLRTVHTTTAQVGTIVTGGTAAAGHRNGAGTSAQFNFPSGAAAAAAGTLYVADFRNHRVREVRAGATASATRVNTIAGSGTGGYADDATGITARFDGPRDLALSGTTLYVSDQNNHRIRAIDLASATVRDVAGDGTRGSTNGIGTAARLTRPTGIFVSAGTLYVTSGDLIRKLEYR